MDQVDAGAGTIEAAFATAVAAHQAGRLDEAAAGYQAILNARPDHAPALSNLGAVLQTQGRVNEAANHYHAAVTARPDYPEAWNNLGLALMDLGRLPEATIAFRRAVASRSDYAEAHVGLGMTRLLAGDLVEGWREYDWRLLQREFVLTRPQGRGWNGSALGGQRILLAGEQGYGDTIQFVRYARMVAARGGRVILSCHPPLARLLRDVPGVETVVDDVTKSPPYACWAPLMSLPLVFGTTLETIPAETPYIHAEARLAALWRGRLSASRGLKVGVVWRGDANQRRDRERSSSASAFAGLLAGMPGVSVVSLQKDATHDELAELGVPVLDAGPRLATFADTAAVIANLDLVISVETAVAHLAGAMGARIWTLLPFAPDWRWLLGRADSPWYPTMRLFRQPATGDWQSVVGEARQALEALKADG